MEREAVHTWKLGKGKVIWIVCCMISDLGTEKEQTEGGDHIEIVVPR